MKDDIQVLRGIRKKFIAAAATCSKRTKAIVQVTTEMIAARRGRNRGTLGKVLGRLK